MIASFPLASAKDGGFPSLKPYEHNYLLPPIFGAGTRACYQAKIASRSLTKKFISPIAQYLNFTLLGNNADSPNPNK